MSCGLFPVATNIPGNREVIHDGVNGILFPVGDVSKLTEAIVSAFKNKDMVFSALSRNRAVVEDRFSLERNLAKMEDIYLEAILQNR